MTSEAPPLAGLMVLDLSRLLPGGYCTLLLADLGADVVKVEEPGRGDYIRSTPPLVEGQSAAHLALNRGKRSVTLDLKSAEGPDLLARLAERADVLVEAFRPGVLDGLGCGYDALAARNPALVWCAITGYGQDGPYRDVAGHDVNYMGYGGALWLGGPTGSEPHLPGVQAADLGGAAMAAVGILAAVVERGRTGRGRLIDVGMLDVVVSWLSIHVGSHLAGREAPGGVRALSGDLACYRVYRTKDSRHVTVGALEPKFWRALCETLECPDMVDQQYGPPERQGEMAARLQRAFEARTRDEWLETFSRVPACVGPVNDLAEALRDPQVRHRRMLAEAGGREVGPASPLEFGRSTAGSRVAPRLGEHTEEVLAEIGVGERDVARLRAQGVV